MALSGSRLGTTFQQAYANHKQRITPTDFSVPVTQAVIDASLQQLYQDLGTDVVSEITTNAIVPPGITVSTPPYSGATIGNGSIV